MSPSVDRQSSPAQTKFTITTAILMRGPRVIAPATSTARAPLNRQSLLDGDSHGFLPGTGRKDRCAGVYMYALLHQAEETSTTPTEPVGSARLFSAH